MPSPAESFAGVPATFSPKVGNSLVNAGSVSGFPGCGLKPIRWPSPGSSSGSTPSRRHAISSKPFHTILRIPSRYHGKDGFASKIDRENSSRLPGSNQSGSSGITLSVCGWSLVPLIPARSGRSHLTMNAGRTRRSATMEVPSATSTPSTIPISPHNPLSRQSVHPAPRRVPRLIPATTPRWIRHGTPRRILPGIARLTGPAGITATILLPAARIQREEVRLIPALLSLRPGLQAVLPGVVTQQVGQTLAPQAATTTPHLTGVTVRQPAPLSEKIRTAALSATLSLHALREVVPGAAAKLPRGRHRAVPWIH